MRTTLVYVAIFLSLCFVQAAWTSSKKSYDLYNSKMMRLKHMTTWLEMGTDFRLRVVHDKARKLNLNSKPSILLTAAVVSEFPW